MMKAKFKGPTNPHLTEGEVYDAEDIRTEHGPTPLMLVVNDQNEEAIVVKDRFEIF